MRDSLPPAVSLLIHSALLNSVPLLAGFNASKISTFYGVSCGFDTPSQFDHSFVAKTKHQSRLSTDEQKGSSRLSRLSAGSGNEICRFTYLCKFVWARGSPHPELYFRIFEVCLHTSLGQNMPVLVNVVVALRCAWLRLAGFSGWGLQAHFNTDSGTKRVGVSQPPSESLCNLPSGHPPRKKGLIVGVRRRFKTNLPRSNLKRVKDQTQP